MQTDTICATATAPGGALGIIRVSGPEAIHAVSAICKANILSQTANTVCYTHVVDADGMIVDEVMVTAFRAPRSYTGEDSVELSCHGSSYILQQVMQLLIGQGCRMAGPGEFTQRAYLNGKLDLSQAEAVADLIASTNEATHHMAMNQLRGGISTQLSRLRDQLLELTSLLELELDFSDHEDLEFADRSQLVTLAQTIDDHITRLADSFKTGQAIKQGIPVAIVGKTNVGKSTLLNHLVHDERAIVSDIHGTTRDTIEDTIDIHGITFRFIDTAGLRQTADQVEQIGISRTYAAIEKARIILWVFDQVPFTADIQDMTVRTAGRALLPISNKTDLSPAPIDTIANQPVIAISAKHNQGLEALEEAIFKAANLPTLADTDVIITSARHYEALQRAHDSLQRVLSAMQQHLSGDLIAEDLRLTLNQLSEITGGQITPTEVLSNIFSHFCVGK